MDMQNENGSTPVPGPQNAPQPTQPTQAGAYYAAGATGKMPPHNTAYGQQAQSYWSQPVAQPVPPAGGAYSSKPKKSGSSSTGKTFGIAFLGAALACVIAFACMFAFNSSTGKAVTGSTVIGATESTPVNVDDDTQLAEAVSEKVLPSVVCVNVYTSASSYYYGYALGGSSNELTESSLGSGVIISKDGYILTNYHVIEGAEKLTVTAGGKSYDATIVGSDASSDLAVLKIDGSNLSVAEIGKSSDLKTGEWVMSAGSPFGLEESVATGIVSATSRTVSGSSSDSSTSSSTAIYSNMIQTDAAINPGNSGGALVDSEGKLIGINTLIASYSGNYSGVGFAIPIDYAIDIAQQIIDGKTPSHAQIGISATTVNSTIAKRYNLATDSGAYVSQVYANSGAEAADIKQGDIITKFNGAAVTSASDLIADVRSCGIGETVDIEVNRGGQTLTLSVTLGSDEGTASTSGSQGSGGNQYGYGSGSNGSGSNGSGSNGFGLNLGSSNPDSGSSSQLGAVA